MSENQNIIGCYISYPSVMYDSTDIQKEKAKIDGDLFRSYIWGENGIDNVLKELKYRNYGNDIILVLFQFYINPISYELKNIKEIESYRKKEKSIGIPIIINNDNFFNKSEEARYSYLRQSILQKIDLLAEVVKVKKLDTNLELFKKDVNNVLNLI